MKNFILFLALVWGWSASAQVIVDPSGDLARFKVVAPDGVNPQDLSILKTKFVFSDLIQSSEETLKLNTVYEVSYDKVCISAEIDGEIDSAVFRNCDYDLKRGQETIIKLGLAKFVWDPEQFYAFLGPVPALVLGGPLAVQSLTFKESEKPGSQALLPQGEYSISLKGVTVLNDYKLNFSVAANEQETVKINLPERRAKIRFLSSPRVYPVAKVLKGSKVEKYGSYRLMRYRSPSWAIDPPTFNDGKFSYGNDGSDLYYYYDSSLSWKKLSDDLTDKEFLVFPPKATDGRVFDVMVNGIAVPLKLSPQKTSTVALETINVDKLNDVETSVYSVIQRNAGEFTFTWLDIYGSTSMGYFPTETSVDVPKGWVYEVITYKKDFSGAYVPVDSDVIDLR